jgi:hypothetical protein
MLSVEHIQTIRENFNLIRKHVRLKKDVSWLKGGKMSHF